MKMALRYVACLLALSMAVPTLSVAQEPAELAAPVRPEQINGTFPDGTRWILETPADWNGVVLLDLDAAGFLQAPEGAPARPRSPFQMWLFSQGYAVGGITREPVGYDFPRAVDYMLAVRQAGIERWGEPRLTIATGGSRGAFAVRKALELHPEIFDGGFMTAGGGAGEIAVLNNKLNALFVLKTLVNPSSPLELVDIEDLAGSNAALQELVRQADSTPLGRARQSLAAAVVQFATWTDRNAPRPAPGDYHAMLEQITDDFPFAIALPVRAGVERIAGGNVSWNTGVDYANLLQLSGRTQMVEALYAEAGASLAEDLATLAEAPRISADPEAVLRAEPLMTYSGHIEDPVVNLDNDDPVDPASDKYAYFRTLQEADAAELLRIIWSDMPGHGGQTDLDRAAAFTLLMERIETGRWADTSVSAMRARAEAIARESEFLSGESRVFDPGAIPPPASEWDASDWGTYTP